MEYLIKQVIKIATGEITVPRGQIDFESYPSKFDEVKIKVSDNQVTTEIVHIENNTIFVQKITP